MFLCGFGILIFEPGLCATSFGVKLHHRRPQAVGGFKKWFGTHEIAATGMMKMSAISAGDHFIYVYFVRFRLLCCNAKCQKTMTETSDGGATIWIQTLESSSIGLSNWMCWKHRRMKLKDDIILNPGVLWTSKSAQQRETRRKTSWETSKTSGRWAHLIFLITKTVDPPNLNIARLRPSNMLYFSNRVCLLRRG